MGSESTIGMLQRFGFAPKLRPFPDNMEEDRSLEIAVRMLDGPQHRLLVHTTHDSAANGVIKGRKLLTQEGKPSRLILNLQRNGLMVWSGSGSSRHTLRKKSVNNSNNKYNMQIKLH